MFSEDAHSSWNISNIVLITDDISSHWKKGQMTLANETGEIPVLS